MSATFELRMTARFRNWFANLRDRAAAERINRRLERLRDGHFGLRRVLGEGVWELKVDAGPGYRIYYRQARRTVVFLLCGGDKGSQREDIALALRLAREMESGDGT